MKQFLLAFTIVTVAAVLIYIFRQRRKFTVEVEATVIGVNEKLSASRHGRKIMLYQPEFSYEWNGFQRVIAPKIWSSTYKYKTGDKVKLLINPDDPSDFRFSSISDEPLYHMILLTASGILLIMVIKSMLN